MFPAAKRILLPSWLLALWIIAAVWTCLPDASKNSVWKIFYNSLQTSLPKIIVLSVNQQDKIQISWQIASEQTYPVVYTDPTGRIATPFLQNAGAQASNLSHSIADTVLDAVPGGISLLSSAMGYGMNLMGMQAGHLHAQAAWLNERLSPNARAGLYDPNSLVATTVAAGSVIIAPGSAPTKIASKGAIATSGVKPLFGKPGSAASVQTKALVPYSGQATPTSWPGNAGFLGSVTETELTAGTLIDRFGPRATGYYVAPKGTPFSSRGLPASYESGVAYEAYEVLQPFQVKTGLSAPGFGSPGLGIQHQLPLSVQQLIDIGVLKSK